MSDFAYPLHEECGVFGIYDRAGTEDVAAAAYSALYALQHRGQESCGIAVNDDGVINGHRDLGLVNEVLTPAVLASLAKPTAHMATGHVRYATAGSRVRANAQPMIVRHGRGTMALCHNGNLTNALELRRQLENEGAIFHGSSDTEVICYLVTRNRLRMGSIEIAISKTMDVLEGAYSLVVMSATKLIAARDPIGIRPLFYGYSKSSHKIAFASEMQNLIGWCDDIRPFPIGSYYCDGRFVRYEDIADVPAPMQDDMDTVLRNIREKLIAGVEKRLDADAPVGFLLSGGLDSSLVCAIARRELNRPIRTFAIGMDVDAIDLKYARQVAEYIQSEHTEVIITKEDVLRALPTVVELLATYDITTIRASVGMYLVCKYIHEHTDVRLSLIHI